MPKPLISVIIPTYNRAHTIHLAIESVLAQDYENFEVIIVDDGSTDNTKSRIESFHNSIINYFFQANRGPSSARNFGASKAKGEWVMYLDSDDSLLPNCLATMQLWTQRNPKTVFAFPRADRRLELYENGKLVKSIDDSRDTPLTFTIHDIFMRNAGFSCNAFMHLRSLASEGLLWDENLSSMEDWELMMTIGEKYPDGFLYVPVVLYTYRQRFGSDNIVSRGEYKTWADAFEYIYNKHASDKLLKGQTWYPAKKDKWNRYQREYEAGTRPSYQYHYFPDSSKER
jgi:glycosyltransferase involved in cell wall biosynthesis